MGEQTYQSTLDQLEHKRQRWLAHCQQEDLIRELHAMGDDPQLLQDAFYRDLAFGTGGLRGVLGAGTNRMSEITVAKATQGLANHLKQAFSQEKWVVAISYDSRIKSAEFAQVAGRVLAANGIRSYIYDRLMPTPCLSFAVRALHCAAGIMVTASHNPAKYNGYKVYGPDGCQMTTEAADRILQEMNQVDAFDDVRQLPPDHASFKELMQPVPEQVVSDYLDAVLARRVVTDASSLDLELPMVYTPLHGTGMEPVWKALQAAGFTSVSVPESQRHPDGRFPTCPYPNPEEPAALSVAIAHAKDQGAELVVATDPDCDRVGAAVRSGADFTLITGNEMGLLLLDYICARKQEMGQMPPHPVMVKTIVTTDLAEKIADDYGVKTVNVLTGFKFIGETIGRLEAEGREGDYLLGFEESYGYLSGTYVRDKDAVNGVLLIAEMAAYYRRQGKTLLDQLQSIYQRYGFALNTLYSFTFEGAKGFVQMGQLMEKIRRGVQQVGPLMVERTLDYLPGLDGLPSSDVLKFILEGGASLVIRPSGTEPKLKAYLSVWAASMEAAHGLESQLARAVADWMQPA